MFVNLRSLFLGGLAREMTDPAIAVYLVYRHGALENLVALQAQEHPHGLELPHKLRQRRQNQHHAPLEDEVVIEHVKILAHIRNIENLLTQINKNEITDLSKL